MNTAESAREENRLSAARAAARPANEAVEILRRVESKIAADRAAIMSEWTDRDMLIGGKLYKAGQITIIDALDHAAHAANAGSAAPDEDAELGPLGSETPLERAQRVIAKQPTDLTIEQVTAQRDLWIISASEWEARMVKAERISSRDDGLRHILFDLAIAASKLVVATDGQEAIRDQRRKVLDYVTIAEAALAQGSNRHG